jgi:ankyrin repeat protein
MPMQEPPQSPPRPPSASELDDDTLAFARKVFHYARTGEAGELATLLGQGLPPNLRNERGDSLLMLACYHGHADAARVLLDHGAAVDHAGPNGKTALMVAAMFNRGDIVRLLLARGADPFRLDADGNAILDAARRMGAADTAELLAAATNERRAGRVRTGNVRDGARAVLGPARRMRPPVSGR